MALLSLRDVSLAFGGPRLLDHVDLHVERGERVCVLGRNGEGKSTLLRLMAGEVAPDEGEVVRPQGLRTARLAQEVPQGLSGSVAEEVMVGLGFEGHAPDPHDHRVGAALSRVGLDPDARFSDLSSGMKRRALLARALVGEPDILLLDEPTNHLDIDSIRWLEESLLRSPPTLVLVTHDRALLGRLATRIVEIDRGKLYDWACDYPTFLKRKEDLLAARERQEALFDRRLAQEEVWIRKGVEARRTRNEGRVRALEAMREAHRQRRRKQGTARMVAQEAGRSGSLVIEAEGVSFGYGGRPVVRDLTTTVMRGDRLGVVGPNGSGKTTVIRLLLGELTPQAGTVRHGTNLEVAYFDQLRNTLDGERTVQQNVSEYETVTVNGQPRHVLGYLQDFLFPPERSRGLVRYLSGGERGRLLLAKLFARPSNVLVLDEPTNDLDVETLELLEGLLVGYQGTVLLVSHDRAFLNGVVTSTLVIEEGGRVREYDGGYDDYLRQRQEAARPEPEPSRPTAATPQPDRPRKLGYKEQRELEALPGRIEALEREVRSLHEEMARPEFYRSDGTVIAESRARLESVERELAAAYGRWEELEGLAG
jgi:ATP-binding cassette subfamily F protein uup